MITALRARIREIQSADDAGFVLVYVLGIIAIVTILVGSTLTITANTIVPTVRSAYSEAAAAAAQGGLQAFVAYADAHCDDSNASVALCTLPTNRVEEPINLNGAAAGYSAKYVWYAQKDPDDRYFRVVSKGTVAQGGMTISKTVVADVVGGASTNLFDYGVVTGFESQSSSTVLAHWPRRTIALNPTAIDAAGVPIKGGAITWSGASPGTAAGKVAVCNASFDEKGGRSNNLPHDAPNPYVDWTESGLKGNNYTHFQPCQTSWGTGTQLLPPLNPADGAGGYYSADAMLLSNSYPGGTGPLFDQPVKTGWRYQPDDAGICGTNAGKNYRSFDLTCAGYPVEVGGSPSPDSTAGEPQWAAGPSIPKSEPTIPADACVYAGPTRVRLVGDNAIVTSPQTTPAWVEANAGSRPSQCYAGAGANGLALQKINLVSPTAIHVIATTANGKIPTTTPAIAHGSSGWPTTGQRAGDAPSTSNSVFYVSSGSLPAGRTGGSSVAADGQPDGAPGPMSGGCDPTTGSAYSAAPNATCAWSNVYTATDGNGAGGTGWTSYSGGTKCSGLAPTDRQIFECEFHGGTPPADHDEYGLFRDRIQIDLSRRTCLSGSAATQLACLKAFVTSELNPANQGDHRYVVSASSASDQKTIDTTLSANKAPATGDPFFDSTTTPGTPTVQRQLATQMTFTVGRQVQGCYVPDDVSIGTLLRSILSALKLTAEPGSYDPTGKLCGQLSILGLGSLPGPGTTAWGDGGISADSINKSVPQFTFTVTQSAWSMKNKGTQGVSSFPYPSDVTQYQMGTGGTFGASGPGDLYVEGTANHTMALVASDDAIITGKLTTSDIDASTLEVVGQNNVRVYHPVTCKDSTPAAIAATDPGFCPNDITGLYTTLPPDGRLPYQQYVNMRPDLANLTVNGAVLALGNSPAHITCPQPPDGGGVCGGEITVDNYGRGDLLGHLNFVGTIAMAHHAPVGLEWEIPDTSGQKSRAYSGYQLAQRYQNLTKLISETGATSGLLQTVSSTSSLWHIVSVSSAPNTGETP